jgi:hypothetical protein
VGKDRNFVVILKKEMNFQQVEEKATKDENKMKHEEKVS